MKRGRAGWLAQAIEGIALYYYMSGRDEEARRFFQGAAAELGAVAWSEAALPNALRVRSMALAWFSPHLTRASDPRSVEQGLALLDRPELDGHDTRRERAFLWRRMVWTDLQGGQPLLERSLALYGEIGARWEMAQVMYGLSVLCAFRGLRDEGERYARQSLTLKQELGDVWGIPRSLGLLGSLAYWQGRMEEAERVVRQAVAHSRAASGRDDLEWLVTLGDILGHNGKFSEALAVLEEALRQAQDMGNAFDTARAHQWLCRTWMHLGEYEQARRHGKHVETWWIGPEALGLVAQAQGAYAEGLPTEVVAAAKERGQARDLSEELEERASDPKGFRPNP